MILRKDSTQLSVITSETCLVDLILDHLETFLIRNVSLSFFFFSFLIRHCIERLVFYLFHEVFKCKKNHKHREYGSTQG